MEGYNLPIYRMVCKLQRALYDLQVPLASSTLVYFVPIELLKDFGMV